MSYQTMSIDWRGIEITIGFDAEYFPSLGMAHMEIRSPQPLPITETGYKSIFVPKADIADIKIAAALIRQKLDITADRMGWQPEIQLSLF